jgi:peptidyl-prolyl cis-trans isomerase SurA
MTIEKTAQPWFSHKNAKNIAMDDIALQLQNRMTMAKFHRFTRFTVGAALLTLASAPLLGQTVADDSVPTAALNIPDQLTIFQDNDPNMRRATVIVNGEIITGTDIDHRLALILAANQNKVSPEEEQRLRIQVVNNLIDEALQIQEAAANEIEVTDDEVNGTLSQIAQQNFKLTLPQMERYLRERNSSPNTLRRQIKGELAWNRLLRRNVQPFINVSDDEVNAIIERLNASKGTTEFRIGEIYMSATEETAAGVNDNMRRILEQLQQGGSFLAYARQFSEASTRSVGGDLGWVRPATLPLELADAAAQMQVGQVAGPIPVPGGFSILLLIDKRQVLSADPRDAILALKQLSISFPANTTQQQVAARAREFAEATRGIRGCGNANEVAASIGADIVDNDRVLLRELPDQLQQLMLGLQVGQSSPPFGSVQDGVRVLVVCGRDEPQTAAGPSFDQIMNNLEQERVNKRAQIYLRDLRRDAVIDYN